MTKRLEGDSLHINKYGSLGKMKKLKMALRLIFELILTTGLCIGARFNLAKRPRLKIIVLSKKILVKSTIELKYIITM